MKAKKTKLPKRTPENTYFDFLEDRNAKKHIFCNNCKQYIPANNTIHTCSPVDPKDNK